MRKNRINKLAALLPAIALAALTSLPMTAQGCGKSKQVSQGTKTREKEGERTISPPVGAEGKPLSETPRRIVISIAADGTTSVAGRQYDRQELGEMLNRVAKEQPDREILIRADGDAAVRHFTEVVELCHKAGIKEAKIGYLIRPTTSGPSE